ncbi:DUF1330 domain-containing protein [Streptomyces sp. NPDC102360]|uniref:DUF1330 domain-containing protein n=1 Tax=Streptomyces sp. NPDC102360 TaxID=3366160 RepID=UPI0037F6D49E
MTAYAIAVLGTTPGAPHPDVLTYIERVQSTFAPYGGRFLVHGKPGEWVEGVPQSYDAGRTAARLRESAAAAPPSASE